MTAEIIEPDFITSLDIPAERVLRKAQQRELETVIVIGYDEGGNEYFASSIADGGTALWLLERCKRKLLAAGDKVDK